MSDDYGQELRQKMKQGLDHTLQQAERAYNNKLHEQAWQQPPGTIVTAVERDSKYIQLWEIPRRKYIQRAQVGEIIFIPRSDVVDWIAALRHCEQDSPLQQFGWQIGKLVLHYYASQIPSLIKALEQTKNFHGPAPYFFSTVAKAF